MKQQRKKMSWIQCYARDTSYSWNSKRLSSVLSQLLEVDTWPLDLSCIPDDFLVWSCTGFVLRWSPLIILLLFFNLEFWISFPGHSEFEVPQNLWTQKGKGSFFMSNIMIKAKLKSKQALTKCWIDLTSFLCLHLRHTLKAY